MQKNQELTLLLAHEIAASVDGRATVVRIHCIYVLALSQLATQLGGRSAGTLLGCGGKHADMSLLLAGLQPRWRHNRGQTALGQRRWTLHAQIVS